MPTVAAAGGVRVARRSTREASATATLIRVREILEATCKQDGQGRNLQEIARRKAYRVGINRALAEINAVGK